MPRTRDLTADAPGQDSFLDVLANMVGILIIFVMAVGVATKDAFLEASKAAITQSPAGVKPKPVGDAPSVDELESTKRDVTALRRELQHLTSAAKNVSE